MPKTVSKLLLFLFSSLKGIFIGSTLSVFVSHLYYPDESIDWALVPHDIWQSFVWSPIGMISAPFGPPGYGLCEEYGYISIILVLFGVTLFIVGTCLFFVRNRLLFLFIGCFGLVLWNHINYQNIIAMIYR